MRALSVPLLLAAVGCCFADRLINIPTGSKIPYGYLEGQLYFEASHGESVDGYLGIGIGKSFDIALRAQKLDGRASVGTFDFAYNYISPVPGLTPGISIGVQDALDQTRDKRRFYTAVTFRNGLNGSLNADSTADVTVGVQTGTAHPFFVGVMIPFSEQLRILAEHNGTRISAGLEFRPQESFGLRLLFQDQRVLLGAQFRTRF